MLPEGTRYAAIRSRSIDKFFLFIDDVTFVAAEGTPADLTIVGYHVYRNGVRITDTPVEDPHFVDDNVVAGRDYNYFVTAVYSNGESHPSNTVNALLQGIDAAASGQVTIQAVAGGIIVKGLTEGAVTVTSVDGRVVAAAEAAPTVRISLVPGLYVVSAGTQVAKIIVR